MLYEVITSSLISRCSPSIWAAIRKDDPNIATSLAPPAKQTVTQVPHPATSTFWNGAMMQKGWLMCCWHMNLTLTARMTSISGLSRPHHRCRVSPGPTRASS